jgi:hypothetical protein
MVSFTPTRPTDRPAPGTQGLRRDRSSQARAIPVAGTDDASLTLGRRLGVLVVLAALAGAIVLAASGRSDRGGGLGVIAPTPTPAATTVVPATSVPLTGPVDPSVARPSGVPRIVEPERTVVSTATIDLRVVVPDPGVPWDELELRVFRGTRQVRIRSVRPDDLSGRDRVTIRGIPLKRGANKLTVAFANPGGAGPASAPLTVRLDDQPPRLKLLSPHSGEIINHPTVTVRGRTGGHLEVTGRNAKADARVRATADGDGSFQMVLPIKRGRNTLTFLVRDAVGNQRPARVTVVRGNGKDTARITLSRASIRRSALPSTIDATVTVLDADGRPVRNAPVVFSFAVPGPPNVLRELTTSKRGRATWSGIRIAKEAVAGEATVAVRVTLPDGRVLTDTEVFTIK